MLVRILHLMKISIPLVKKLYEFTTKRKNKNGGENPTEFCFLLIKRQNILQNVLFNMLTFVSSCAFVMNVITSFYAHPASSVSFYLLACEFRHQFQICCLVWVWISTHANR